MQYDLRMRLQSILGAAPERLEPLSGGLGAVYRAVLPDGHSVVAKTGTSLEAEAYMLRYLAEKSRLPVPRPIYVSNTLMVMDYIEGNSSITAPVENHAAELVAELHGITSATFGLERDTMIGILPQPNPPTERWLPFFREHRLLYMARGAANAGRLPITMLGRVEKLAREVERWLVEPPAPALLHGRYLVAQCTGTKWARRRTDRPGNLLRSPGGRTRLYHAVQHLWRRFFPALPRTSSDCRRIL